MYAKKIEIKNYGPISQLDICFPFDGDTPKPIVLVGENGSGKSILLSHIVNALASAKDKAYPATPEVETGRVFKLRSSLYVKIGSAFCFARVDFEQDLFMSELTTSRLKREYENPPLDFSSSWVREAWDKMKPNENSELITNINPRNDANIKDIFTKNCVLYFPHDRFEEPAWLNKDNLTSQADHVEVNRMKDHTSRRLISYSTLNENQNWLFSLGFDRAIFDSRTFALPLKSLGINQSGSLPVWGGYSGESTNAYDIALKVIRVIMGSDKEVDLEFGRRLNRTLSLRIDREILVPSIFQLSSGETSLLNLFLSILRDFDLAGTSFSSADEVRGIVVVDEIDLHLHAVHQHEILPNLIQMFPKVQFIVTSHSPLFVLGMNNAFGEDGFALYRLPDGQANQP